MKKQEKIYCEIEFWKALSKMIDSDNNSSDIFSKQIGKSDCARKMFMTILRSNNICFDNEEMFSSVCRDDKYLLTLYKLSENEDYPSIYVGEGSYKNISNLEEADLLENSWYLVSQKTKEQMTQKGSCVLVMTPEYCMTNPNIYKDFGRSIRHSSEANWKTILGVAKHNCNSLMIFDNYVLKNKNENLYEILDALLPTKTPFTFHLSIFTLETPNIQQEYEMIKKKLLYLRKDLALDFSIFIVGRNDFHDRAILTNYIWVGSGGGFDILSKKHLHTESVKTTSIPIFFPFIQDCIDWGVDHYNNFLNEAQKVQRSNRHIGSGINRLLHPVAN